MIYQTYGSIAITPVRLSAMEPAVIQLAGIGNVKCTPMSNIEIWAGAIVLCSWDKEPCNSHPRAMYLVDAEGDVHQFFGTSDVLMHEGVVYDLTMPYGPLLHVANQVLLLSAHLDDAPVWLDTYVNDAIVMNLSGSELVKYATNLACEHQWSDDIVNKIENIKINAQLSPIHCAKRLHYLVAEHEHQLAQRID